MTRFQLGINYWPRRSAMYAWTRFDLGEIREDMARIKGLGLDVVRFFLLWEAFQPQAGTIDRAALLRFGEVMDAIGYAGLRAMPTLFTGHMSGVNWLPTWTLDRRTPHGRFRTMAGGHTSAYGIGDFYADPHLLGAQELFARKAGERVRDHPALLMWDLGNEFSNLREPRTPRDAASWSARLTETLIESSGAGATGGIHGEDFERDRGIRPSSIARPWGIVTMHGYPVYSEFARGRMDPDVVPFLAQLAESCAKRRVLFSEFGNPTCPPGTVSPFDRVPIGMKTKAFACLTEDEMADYCRNVVDRLHARGALGAFWWCWADYDTKLASLPPFDRAVHELHFGIVRNDGSFKPVAHELSRIARENRRVVDPAPRPIVEEREYYASLPRGMFASYKDYCRVRS